MDIDLPAGMTPPLQFQQHQQDDQQIRASQSASPSQGNPAASNSLSSAAAAAASQMSFRRFVAECPRLLTAWLTLLSYLKAASIESLRGMFHVL